MAVGVDLLFNAGLFSGLFDQGREPGLLADEVLFRRVPVAYLLLVVGVIALAWAIDVSYRVGAAAGAILGAGFGLVTALLGVVYVWTAIAMTGLFVAAGALVQVIEFAAAGAVIGACKGSADQRRVTRVSLTVALLAAVAGVAAQNLIGAG
jgi:hypothetical protein